MASFAKLNTNNQVIGVIIVNDDDIKDNNGVPAEGIGVGFLQKNYGADTIWKQSPKGNLAGIGMTYITNVTTLGVASTDIFIGGTKPHASWSIGINTATWYPPDNPGEAPALTDSDKTAGKYYVWNESNYQSNPSTAWVLTDP